MLHHLKIEQAFTSAPVHCLSLEPKHSRKWKTLQKVNDFLCCIWTVCSRALNVPEAKNWTSAPTGTIKSSWRLNTRATRNGCRLSFCATATGPLERGHNLLYCNYNRPFSFSVFVNDGSSHLDANVRYSDTKVLRFMPNWIGSPGGAPVNNPPSCCVFTQRYRTNIHGLRIRSETGIFDTRHLNLWCADLPRCEEMTRQGRLVACANHCACMTESCQPSPMSFLSSLLVLIKCT